MYYEVRLEFESGGGSGGGEGKKISLKFSLIAFYNNP